MKIWLQIWSQVQSGWEWFYGHNICRTRWTYTFGHHQNSMTLELEAKRLKNKPQTDSRSGLDGLAKNSIQYFRVRSKQDESQLVALLLWAQKWRRKSFLFHKEWARREMEWNNSFTQRINDKKWGWLLSLHIFPHIINFQAFFNLFELEAVELFFLSFLRRPLVQFFNTFDC